MGLGVSEVHLAGGFRYGAFTCIFFPSFLFFFGLDDQLDCKEFWG